MRLKQQLPICVMQITKIFLKPKKEDSLHRFHPWIFSGALKSDCSEIKDGELVDVYTSDDKFIAKGHFQHGSIAVRVLSFNDVLVDDQFWKDKLRAAYIQRESLGLITAQNNSYRLVFGEGDGLPGLIVDVYGNTAVLQAHSIGMHLIRKSLANYLIEVSNEIIKNVYYKSETTLPGRDDLMNEDGYLVGGLDDCNVCIENGLKFISDWTRGQKTGFFLDQRDNRALLEKYAHNRKVLNMFCYTGGFSFYAMRGNAQLVHSVDSSSRAIKLTDENIAINFEDTNRHRSFAEDAFKFLTNMTENEYDLLVLDPPAFAKHRGAIKNAMQGYKRINLAAMRKIAKGGVLFTFSCSQAISKEQFRVAVFSAAAASGRTVKILHQLSQPADHPISIFHPEGEYLKGLVLYVE